MILLALETTGDVAEIAITDESGVAASLTFRHGMDLSRLLVPRIALALEMARRAVRDLEGIAVSLGPGSFTGIRIGVATAKALALALDRPIAGVPTLDALAASVAAPPGTLVCPIIDARAGEVYAAVCRATPDGIRRCEGPMQLAIDALATKLAAFSGSVRFAGDTRAYQEALAERFGEAALLGAERAQPAAEVIARLARARLQAGDADDRMTLAPLYVRPSAAEARWKEAACPT
jgi:tRNA threonylcarbamoyladenosine biosynthesis protein TsaB